MLVVDDHARARESMADVLRHAGHRCSAALAAAEALQVLQTARFDCIVTDLMMPGMTGIELIIQLRQRQCPTQIVMVTAHATVATAVEAMRHGAFDYIEKPFEADALERLVTQAMRHGRLVHPEPADALAIADASSPAMIGSSPAMQALRMRILQIGPTSETVLITGESGTGKELVARAIHAASHRHGTPMVSLNCPVLSAHLMESELFGHEKGAFTGADAPRTGRFEAAHGGTILLDEVTEIDLRAAGQAAAGAAREIVRAGRLVQDDARRRPRAGHDEPRFAGRSLGRTLPRRPLLPPGRVAAGRAAAPPASRGRAGTGRLLLQALGPAPAARNLLAGAGRRAVAGRLPLAGQRPRTGEHHHAGERADDDRPRDGRRIAPLADQPCRRKATTSPEESVPVGISLEEMERRLIEATLEHYGGHRARTAKALGIGIRTLSGKLRQYGYAPREKSYMHGDGDTHAVDRQILPYPKRRICRLPARSTNERTDFTRAPL